MILQAGHGTNAQHSAVVVCSRRFWKEQVTVLNAVDFDRVDHVLHWHFEEVCWCFMVVVVGGGGELEKLY